MKDLFMSVLEDVNHCSSLSDTLTSKTYSGSSIQEPKSQLNVTQIQELPILMGLSVAELCG